MDTNVVIDYLGNKLSSTGMEFINDVVDEVPKVSVVTKIELLGFNASHEHLKILSDFINDANVLDLTPIVVETCIELRKQFKTKLPDAIIAATAKVHNLNLITHNVSDFKNIKGLQVVDPHLL